jgi:Ca2+-binding RTX toxin-like protein
VAAAVSIVAMLACAGTAQGKAPAKCTFASGSRILDVAIKRDPADPQGRRSGTAYMAVHRGFVEVFAGSSLSHVNCRGPAPTSLNVETVRAHRGGRLRSTVLYVDQRLGLFAPGNTDEGDGSSEIEFDLDLGPRGVGYFFLTTEDDAAYVRDLATGDVADLNAFESVSDDDVYAHPGTSLFLNGVAGDDSLGATPAAPGPYDPYLPSGGFGVGLFGGGGADALFGSQESDVLVGGAGIDALDGGAGDDALVSADRPRRSDRVDCGDGSDHLDGDRRDQVVACERRAGSSRPARAALTRARLTRHAAPDHLPVRLRRR